MLTAFVAAAAEEEEHNLLFPALPDLIWGTLAFVIILVLFIWKVLPRLNELLDARNDAIEGGIKRAEKAQAEADARKGEYERPSPRLVPKRRVRDQARADGVVILAELKEQASGRGRTASPRTPRCRSRPSAPQLSCRSAPRSARSRSTSRRASSERAWPQDATSRQSSTVSLPTSRLTRRRRRASSHGIRDPGVRSRRRGERSRALEGLTSPPVSSCSRPSAPSRARPSCGRSSRTRRFPGAEKSGLIAGIFPRSTPAAASVLATIVESRWSSPLTWSRASRPSASA